MMKWTLQLTNKRPWGFPFNGLLRHVATSTTSGLSLATDRKKKWRNVYRTPPLDNDTAENPAEKSTQYHRGTWHRGSLSQTVLPAGPTHKRCKFRPVLRPTRSLGGGFLSPPPPPLPLLVLLEQTRSQHLSLAQAHTRHKGRPRSWWGKDARRKHQATHSKGGSVCEVP